MLTGDGAMGIAATEPKPEGFLSKLGRAVGWTLMSSGIVLFAVTLLTSIEQQPPKTPVSETPPPPPLQGIYPPRVSPNGRYLVDARGNPWLMSGDSPQSAFVNLSTADAVTFFQNRQARGFNAAWINLIDGSEAGGRSDYSTYDGIRPFTTPGDVSTPNEAYFARVDAIINIAAQYGICVVLDIVGDNDFVTMLVLNGSTKAHKFGVYVGNRYKNFQNIIY